MASPTLPGWVLLHDGRPVSYSAFNAKTHGVAQVGGVYTPPELQGRGSRRSSAQTDCAARMLPSRGILGTAGPQGVDGYPMSAVLPR